MVKVKYGPKKPLTAYFMFINSRRPAVIKNNPTAEPKRIVSILAKEWRELDERAKATHAKAAEEDTIRYATEFKKWIQNHPDEVLAMDEQKKKIKKRKKNKKIKAARKESGMPKRGLSSYLFYAASVRDQVRKKNPDSKIGDLGKIMGDQWKTMAESKKAKFISMAEKDRARYHREYEIWKQANPDM